MPLHFSIVALSLIVRCISLYAIFSESRLWNCLDYQPLLAPLTLHLLLVATSVDLILYRALELLPQMTSFSSSPISPTSHTSLHRTNPAAPSSLAWQSYGQVRAFASQEAAKAAMDHMRWGLQAAVSSPAPLQLDLS
eukprot:746459-Hanusia_phi.AAC.1